MPPLFLALESSTSTGSVAVGEAGLLRAEMVLDIEGAHSSALLPAVDEVVRVAGIRRADLAGVVVGAGPGSFTGVRIAAATAKGIAMGLGVPLFAYSSLLAAAAAGWGSGGPVCALFDARKRDVFCGCWSFDAADGSPGDGAPGAAADADQVAFGAVPPGRPSPSAVHPGAAAPGAPGTVGATGIRTELAPSAMSIDEVVGRFSGRPAPLFVGSGAVLHADELRRELGATVMPPALGAPRASALIWLRHAVPELGRIHVPAEWEPDYVREPGAVRIAAARAASAR